MGELVFDASSAFLEHFSSPLRSLLYQVFIAFEPLIFGRLSGHGKVRRSKDVFFLFVFFLFLIYST